MKGLYKPNWDQIKNSDNILINVELRGIPIGIKGVDMSFEFLTASKEEELLSRETKQSRRKVLYCYYPLKEGEHCLSFVCDGSSFADADIFKITVIDLYDVNEKQVPYDQWERYGFYASE